jgi:pimeloyl-ACP methyl ester carboxylesterase
MAPASATGDRGPARRRKRVALVLAGVALGLALGVGLDILRDGGLEAWLASDSGASGSAIPPYEARGRLIDVDGRSVYLDCRGAGSPTVILENGFTGGAAGWVLVQDRVAEFTRVCAWDRPGIDRSARRGLHSGHEAAADLRAALSGAGEHGPYVVVAHSLGGVYARLFAAETPPNRSDAVVAFLMLDTYEPDLGLATDATLDADNRALIQRSLDETGAIFEDLEELDWDVTLAELAEAGPVQLPGILLMLDPRGRYAEPDPARLSAIIDAWYRAIAARYPNGRLDIASGTGHVIQYDRPELVIERTRELVLPYRSP